MKLINQNKLDEAINKVGKKKLNESIADDGFNNMDESEVVESTGAMGTAPLSYTAAIKHHRMLRKRAEDAMKDNNKLGDEISKENERDSHDKVVKSDGLKKMKLSESFFEDWKDENSHIPSDWDPEDDFMDEEEEDEFYRTTEEGPYRKRWSIDESKDYDYNFKDLSDEDAQFWMNERDTYEPPLFLDDEGYFDLDESLFEAKEEDLDDVNPFDLVMDTIVYNDRQVQVKDPKTGKESPRAYHGLYGYDKVGYDKDDNITITVDEESKLDPGIQFAKDYEIDWNKKYDKYTKEWILTLDPWTVNVEKLYPDRNKFVTGGMYKKGGKPKNESLLKESVRVHVENFIPSDSAEPYFTIIKEEGKLNDLDDLTDQMYEKGITAEQLDDLLAFDGEWVLEMLNIDRIPE